MMTIQHDAALDCSGQVCPMPVIRTRKAIDQLATGQVLKVTTTDPGSDLDLRAWAAKTGHEILSVEKCGTQYFFLIRK